MADRFVSKVAFTIPVTRELLDDMRPTEAKGKFHLDDEAKLGHWWAMPVFMDPDYAMRPWRFAHANPMPAEIVLFPRAERAARRCREARSEVRRRRVNAVAALRGADFDEGCW